MNKLLSITNFKQIVFVTGITLLASCSQFSALQSEDEKTATATEKTKTSDSKSTEDVEPMVVSKPSNMTAEMMYKVLLAEILIEKRQTKAAFQILYPLAVETRDPALAKRVFQLSMQTLHVDSINAAANLWIDIEPNESLPWKASYLLSVRAGELEKALEKWQKYVSLSDKKIEDIFIETSSRVSKSATNVSGLTFLNTLKELYPDNPAAMYAYGSAAEYYRDYSLAIPELKKVLTYYEDKETDDLTPSLLLVLKETQYSLATCYLRTKDYQEGLDLLEPLVLETPNDWQLQEILARFEVKSGQLLKAEKRYQEIVENEPKALASKLSLALLQLEKHNYTESKQNFLDLRKNKAYFSIASYYLGVASQQQGLASEAVTYFSKIKTRDYYIDSQLRILEINYSKIGLEKTIEKINSLEARTKTNRIKLHQASAVFYRHEGAFQQSVDAYQRAIELSPNNIEFLISQAYILYELKQYSKYEENLLLVLKLSPNNVDALNALGYYYVEISQKLPQATVLLEKANRLKPNSFYIIDSLGWLAYQKNDFDKSERLLEKAFDLQQDIEVLMHLMQVKVKLDRKDEAIELGNKFKNKFKNNAPLKKLLKNIKN